MKSIIEENGKEITIEWYSFEFGEAIDFYTKTYMVNGVSEDGREWIADATLCCDEFEFDNIELDHPLKLES